MLLAHSENAGGEGVCDPLKSHLTLVAKRASEFASAFGLSEQAYVAGLLHDLGKYGDQFQRRLQDPAERGRDHSAAGALAVLRCYKSWGVHPALSIEGHHIGLQKLESHGVMRRRICKLFNDDAILPAKEKQLTESDFPLLMKRFHADGLELPKIDDGIRPIDDHDLANMLDARMLFSTLVDADFLETEAHFNGDEHQPLRYREEGPPLNPEHAIESLTKAIAKRASSSLATNDLLNVRKLLFHDCCDLATSTHPGIFTLSAPTGAGKTLSMLAFALWHAKTHGLRRVIVVMPFLSIIDQTAREYRKIFSEQNGFPPHYVIEDHSNVGSEKDGACDSVNPQRLTARLLAENWDAPIVLTTSVQCLESLMDNRPSACRKLHRMAKSVILFDEVQTIPGNLAVPTLATLSRLCERFGSTVVFSTATQPAFDHLDSIVQKQAASGWKPTEIVSVPARLFSPSATRVKVQWRFEESISWEKLAQQIEGSDEEEESVDPTQMLCIVNLKRHAQTLAQMLRDASVEGTFHLSTNMCPKHRLSVLTKVRARLKQSLPVRLIATQCIEAGVDIDFPVVYRALAPLDAIAQAAGRCNRNGTGQNGGILRVFFPEDAAYPLGAYKRATDHTRAFLRTIQNDGHDLDQMDILNNPPRLQQYYQELYTLTGVGAEKGDLEDAIEKRNFKDVAKHYRLIDGDTINILVPYDETEFEQLCAETEQDDFNRLESIRGWIRRARPHAISLYRPKLGDAKLWNCIEPIQFSRKQERADSDAQWFVALPSAQYDPLLGWCDFDDSGVW